MSAPAIALSRVVFGHGARPLFDGLDLAIEPGAFVGVLGPNGAGKTTLVHLLCGAHAAQGGRVAVGGDDLATLPRVDAARRLALVPQSTAFGFPYRGREVVAMGRHPHQRGTFETAADRAAIDRALALTDTGGFADRWVDTLSGGERQRLLFARAIAQDTDVLVLDEPTSHLDMRHRSHVIRWLDALRAERPRTVLFVTHDVNSIARHADRLIVLDAGRVVADGTPADVLTADVLRRVWGDAVRLVPDPDGGPPLVLPA